MSDSLDLARWQRPAYPRGLRIIQYEDQIVVEPTPLGWQMHNRETNARRKSVGFAIAWVPLVTLAGWLLTVLITSVPSRTLWMWTGIVGGWTLLCGVGVVWVGWRLTRDRPPLLAVRSKDNSIVDSTDSTIVRGKLVSLVIRQGRTTDPESFPATPIVQIAALVEHEYRRDIRALWTFDRSFPRNDPRSVEERLRTVAASNSFDLVIVEGEPPLVAAECV